ncbi:hypothetical protein STTU_1881 [Streptomyces sp. Tu6071]|nr:hypothetical protein STTU_1881 [Streptomyces sp. Tu6071]
MQRLSVALARVLPRQDETPYPHEPLTPPSCRTGRIAR